MGGGGYEAWEEGRPLHPAALRLQSRVFEEDSSSSVWSGDGGCGLGMSAKRGVGEYWALLRRHWHAVSVYCLAFWSFGMSVGFLGPTLWDLGCQTGTVFAEMTWVFFAQSLFITLGTLVAGLANVRFSSHAVLLVSTAVVGATLAAIPLCGDIFALTLVLAVMGLAMGLLDTTSNVLMLELLKDAVAPFIQALHFSYGLGGFLAPLIAEPFLRNLDCTALIGNVSTTSPSPLQTTTPRPEHLVQMPRTLEEAQAKVRVQQAFVILAALQLPVVAAVLSLILSQRSQAKAAAKAALVPKDADKTPEKYERIGEAAEAEKEAKGKWSLGQCWLGQPMRVVTLVQLSGLMLFLADGLQADFSGLVFSYGKLSVAGLGSDSAAGLDAAFWGTFAGGRLLGVGLSLVISPALLLSIDVLGCVGAMLLLVLVQGSKRGLYAVTVGFGLCLSTVLPTTLSLAEESAGIGPSAVSIIVVGASLGEMLYPVVIGHLVDWYGAGFFVASANASTLAMLAVLLALLIAANNAAKQRAKDASEVPPPPPPIPVESASDKRTD